MHFASFYRALSAGCQKNGLLSLWVCYEQAVCDWKALFHARQTCKWGVVCSEERRLSCVPVCSGVWVCIARGVDGISWISVCRVILYFSGILCALLLHINMTKIRRGSVVVCVLAALRLLCCVDITSNGSNLLFTSSWLCFAALHVFNGRTVQHFIWDSPPWSSKSSIKMCKLCDSHICF